MLQSIKLGSYIVNHEENALGTGKQARVFKGSNIYSSELVAIKIFSPESHLAFTSETQFLAKLLNSTRNIVTLKASFISDNLGCIVMPLYCADLFEYILAKKITSTCAKKYFVQICNALQYSHNQGIAHLDIKPENVLIDDNDQCFLCDFGHASLIGELVSGRGTVNYCAPEANKDDHSYDPVAADIWSLGILLYVMISGCFPRSSTQAEDDYSTNLYVGRKYFSSNAFNLVTLILKFHPNDRPSISEILAHPWCKTTSTSAPKLTKFATGFPNVLKKTKFSSLR